MEKVDRTDQLVYFSPFLFRNRNAMDKEKSHDQMNKKANLEMIHNGIMMELYSKNALPVGRRRGGEFREKEREREKGKERGRERG